ncbi:30S ribosomal protein S18 [Chloroflexota bacterium]
MAKPKPGKANSVRRNRPRYVATRKVCSFCAGKIQMIGYKDAEKLHGFVSDRGKIAPRRRTGTCARHQRILARAIKRARHLALLPYVPAHMRRVGSVGIGA